MRSATALLWAINQVAANDAALAAAFPGGYSHGITDVDPDPEPLTDEQLGRFDANYAFTVQPANDEANENTDGTREDQITVRYQCWENDDSRCLAKLSLLQNKFGSLALEDNDARMMKVIRTGFTVDREPVPDQKGFKPWQGLIDLQYRINQRNPRRLIVSVTDVSRATINTIRVTFDSNLTAVASALGLSAKTDGATNAVTGVSVNSGKLIVAVANDLDAHVTTLRLSAVNALTFANKGAVTNHDPYPVIL